MLNHGVDGFVHTVLYRIWFQNDLWGPHFAAFLSEKGGWIGLFRFLVRFTTNTSMIWRTNIFHLAQMLALECRKPLRTHGICIAVIARIPQNIVKARKR